MPNLRSGVGPENRIDPLSCCCFIQSRCWSRLTVHSSRRFMGRRITKYQMKFSLPEIMDLDTSGPSDGYVVEFELVKMVQISYLPSVIAIVPPTTAMVPSAVR